MFHLFFLLSSLLFSSSSALLSEFQIPPIFCGLRTCCFIVAFFLCFYRPSFPVPKIYKMLHKILITLFILFTSIQSHNHRRRRDDSEDVDDIRNTLPCDVVCEAQWKSEFHTNFHRLYDTQYFEIPLDSTIVKNRASLKMFCSSTQQKYACFRRDCKIHRTPWSPDKHICVRNYEQFDKNINCLSLTDRYVQKECSTICDKNITLSHIEKQRLHELRLSHPAITALEEQNNECHFIACHQMCHEYVVSKLCIDSASSARELLKKYYDSYLEREYTALRKNGHGTIFSSFCRRVTPEQNENAITPNMTVYNNGILDIMKNDIRNIFQNLV
ncbi:unnamed protein product [Caenorhabditis angaria]|uniref:Uncharacterized protein n=1 Tax=Caenorhabditis angaria TaxID=860376 RepID=A0A9P1J336_9PELO|nr:unnamed protein product [Caenorhabditis angaria]